METKTTFLETELELLNDDTPLGEAFSAISLNRNFQWAKIVVTDDLPNANKMRIPLEEFDNMINTGVNAPIKMAEATISPGHKEAFGKAIGVITNLTKETNKIIALAALWKKERPEDVTTLKDMYTKGQPPNVSWEVSYAESSLNEDIEELKGVSLDGLCVVGMPAYEGRTSFVAMSSKDEDKSEDEDESKDEDEERKILDETQALKDRIAELEKQLEAKAEELKTSQAELDEMKSYKDKVELEKAEAEKIKNIKDKFAKAEIEKDEEYFTTNLPVLLNLDEAGLDFMLQEMVAFKKQAASSKEDKLEVPRIPNLDNVDLSDPKALARALKEFKK